MKFTSEKEIEITKRLSELDLFVCEFVRIVEKYTPYVIISGYVSILLGRSRSSEDVDMILPDLEIKDFEKIYNSLIKEGFYCLNTNSLTSAYTYLQKKTAIRFAKKGTIIPNMEIKFAHSMLDNDALATKIKVQLEKRKIYISNLELQIAFKEQYLKSQKDIEDAKHLRIIAQKYIDKKKLTEYEARINEL
ncbi:MAG: hypothetical protein ACMXYE_05355 [Candidatus Woesearchaeota archaeon]